MVVRKALFTSPFSAQTLKVRAKPAQTRTPPVIGKLSFVEERKWAKAG